MCKDPGAGKSVAYHKARGSPEGLLGIERAREWSQVGLGRRAGIR